jgi:peroxiredoxin
MIELGELEAKHEEFDNRHVKIIAVSNDELTDAKETQEKFPHLLILADTKQTMANALQVVLPQMGPNQTDTNAPTTFLVDGTGKVRWRYRPGYFLRRLSPAELLVEVDRYLPKK